ncbi:hypothetical protein OsJ_06917 [Oryza sativa Japonica Group]|uniref:FAR1 domain-containing protein n=1 Tax=Oryza sativa subsp. japonica TaxID=39947 RepID=B9F094_ORYSJ|nr:hypothetical protein OsJ_06917 [Oryza sativa Japonica Group]
MSSARSVASPSAAQVGGGSSARDVEQQKSVVAVGASSPVSSSKQHNLAKEENGTITANGDKQQKPAADRIVVEGEEDSDLLPISLSDPAILLPEIGQTFNEDSNGYAFYNLYARFTGFGIRRSKNRYKDEGVKSMQEFCCIREGRDNSVTGPPTRIGCKAMYGFTEIPKKYILKRWTKDARDSIPKHLEESYLKDKEAASSRTYRNTLLHKSALDMVRLGGTSSETYEKTLEVLTKLIGELQVMCTSQVVNNKEIHCGDRTIGKKPTGVQLDDSVDSSDSEHGMPDDFCVADEDGIGQDVSAGEDSVDVDMTDVNEEDILPPEVNIMDLMLGKSKFMIVGR